MRVLEPHQFKGVKRGKTPRSKRPLVVLLAAVLVIGAASYGLQAQENRKITLGKQKTAAIIAQQNELLNQPKTTPKVFSGNQFKTLYQEILQTYPNTEAFMEYPKITDNPKADNRIREVAKKQGFQPTRMPVTALIKTNEPRLQGETDDLLQPLAYKYWQDLKAEAEAAKIPLSLLSAYRSPDWQRELFLLRLFARGGNVDAIAAGVQDAVIESTLIVTGVPGYSRHHTGYTVDFWCEDGSGSFGSSTCFKWLTENNYLHAKEHGWMPSYPPEADLQGPEPEPWEYVWVGRDNLYD